MNGKMNKEPPVKPSWKGELVPRDTIIRNHGLLVAYAAYIDVYLRRFSLRHWWNSKPNKEDETEYDKGRKKPKPRYQDIFVLWMFVPTIIVTITGHVSYGFSGCLASIVTTALFLSAAYLLLDILVYHLEVLWFYDFFAQGDRRVWSHRRILFEAGINFVAIVALFSLFYRLFGTLPGKALIVSLSAATLNPPESIITGSLLDYWYGFALLFFQMAVSLLFLGGVFTVMISKGYNREEIAADELTCCVCKSPTSEASLVSIKAKGVVQKVCEECIQSFTESVSDNRSPPKSGSSQ